MIKFWKSAAKGKTGCPVRPPELMAEILLNNPERDTHDGNQKYTFRKKSKLSIDIHDTLVKKIALNYLTLYMDSIKKHYIIQCWLELETFKCSLSFRTESVGDGNNQLSRTKSFDVPSENKKNFEDKCRSEKCSLSENNADVHPKNTRQDKSDHSSSCNNLSENIKVLRTSDERDCHNTNATEESIKLFKKYVALEAPFPIDLPDDIRKTVISNICQPEGLIKADCFKPVQDVLFKQIEIIYKDFENSPYYIRAQIEILSTETLTLEDILYNETILFYFTEYLEQESCRILLEFLIAVVHFRDNFNNETSFSPEQAQTDAIILYDKYISLQATTPVGFPTDIRLHVESEICREGGPLFSCYDLPYQIVFRTLTSYVKTFLESELYYKYITEMIQSVSKTSSNHKSHSDCSSEFSISSQNTLLAMGDLFPKKRNHSVPDMTIDSNQLYNADALWQRKRHEGLILGRVNSLGRFESKFEPDPDKKQKSVIKKMVSRFVPTMQSKVEEEMAWQIAHMIVKDVTDLTMAPPDNDDVSM